MVIRVLEKEEIHGALCLAALPGGARGGDVPGVLAGVCRAAFVRRGAARQQPRRAALAGGVLGTGAGRLPSPADRHVL